MMGYGSGYSLVAASLGAAACLCACAGPAALSQPPTVVSRVDLARYAGLWYEIARFPFGIQEGCYGTTATYSLRPDGKVDVLNQCRRGAFEGELSKARGTAKVVDPATNAKLKVTFFWPFYGDYWVVDLGADYEYAVVSQPSRKYLWILSRTPTLPDETYRAIVARLTVAGFDTARLKRTPQKTE